MKEFKVAIILPMYNASKWIERAVSSVLEQSFKNWKLYIIDDCSKDDSVKIIKTRFNDDRINIFLNEVNLGAAKTRNRGLEIVSEDIVFFLDSDDEWDSRKIQLQLEAVSAGNNLVISEYIYSNRNKNHIKYKSNVISQKNFLKKKFRICFSSVCINFSGRDKEFFKIIGHEDFEYLNRCFENISSGQACVINIPLVTYYCQENSLSSNKFMAAKWHYNILKNELNQNLFQRLKYFGFYMVNAVMFSKKYK